IHLSQNRKEYMVAEKQQERHTNDKRRKFRRPFQRSPTSGAQRSNIGKEKDKVHKHVSSDTNTGGDLHVKQANGNSNSRELVEGSNQTAYVKSSNEPRQNNRQFNPNSGSNKNLSGNKSGGNKDHTGTQCTVSEKAQVPLSTGKNDDGAKQSFGRAKSEKSHQQQACQGQKQMVPQNQKQAPAVTQNKHQSYPPSYHGGSHDNKFSQDRRGKGYSYSSNSRQHYAQGSAQGGSYDSGKKMTVSGSGGHSNSYNSQQKAQHKSQQQFHHHDNANKRGSLNSKGPNDIESTNSTGAPVQTTGSGPQKISCEKSGAPGQPNDSKREFCNVPTKKEGQQQGYNKQQYPLREHPNHHQKEPSHKGAGAPHKGEAGDSRTRESREPKPGPQKGHAGRSCRGEFESRVAEVAHEARRKNQQLPEPSADVKSAPKSDLESQNPDSANPSCDAVNSGPWKGGSGDHTNGRHVKFGVHKPHKNAGTPAVQCVLGPDTNLGAGAPEDVKKRRNKKKYGRAARCHGAGTEGIQGTGRAKERFKNAPELKSQKEAPSNENEPRNVPEQNPVNVDKIPETRRRISHTVEDCSRSGSTGVSVECEGEQGGDRPDEGTVRLGSASQSRGEDNAREDLTKEEDSRGAGVKDVEDPLVAIPEAKEGVVTVAGDLAVGAATGGAVAAGPWRRANFGAQTVDSLEAVRRTVKSLLNKITVEKFTVIAEKLAVCIDEIRNVEELEELVKQVLDKAITEPDFSEMYADLCQILKWRSPVLECGDGKSSIGFSRALLARCEQEFKNMPRNMTPTEEERQQYDSEELNILYRKRKLHVLGIIRLIGELFIRKMFPMRSLNELVFDLVMIQESPDEYAIECLCQLIMTTGYYLDSNEKSRMIVDQWFGRLKELQNTTISTRLNCLIQDVFDLRKHKWVKKVHKQKAKALADILKDMDVEDVLGGAAIAAQYGSVVVVGERSNLVGNSAYYNYMTSQEELYLSRQKSAQK
ncbi:Mif4g domain-containing protein, partial [Cryptosporidium felis]